MAKKGDPIWDVYITITRLKTTQRPADTKKIRWIYMDGEEKEPAYIVRIAMKANLIAKAAVDFRRLDGLEKKFKIDVIEKIAQRGEVVHVNGMDSDN